jgi:ATP-dependent RNA helicase DeaD
MQEVALAALLLVEEAAGTRADEVEIPAPTAPREGGAPPGGKGPGRAGSRRGGPPAPGTTRVYVGLGRDARIRPGDLVGAIAGETRLSGKAIGSIEITARFSLVEVPEDAVDEVIAALRATRIKGRKATVRRDAKAGGG